MFTPSPLKDEEEEEALEKPCLARYNSMPPDIVPTTPTTPKMPAGADALAQKVPKLSLPKSADVDSLLPVGRSDSTDSNYYWNSFFGWTYFAIEDESSRQPPVSARDSASNSHIASNSRANNVSGVTAIVPFNSEPCRTPRECCTGGCSFPRSIFSGMFEGMLSCGTRTWASAEVMQRNEGLTLLQLEEFPFQIAGTYPAAPRSFLEGCLKERYNTLCKSVEQLPQYFSYGNDGKHQMAHLMNSPDLKSEPDEKIPECDAFKNEIKRFFSSIIAEQMKIESSTSYGVNACALSLQAQYAWVIGAKSPDSHDAPILSIGDTLVANLIARTNVRHVWSTSRSPQDGSRKHTHFSCDLNQVSTDEFVSHMQRIDAERKSCCIPLTVYFIFGNTGANTEATSDGLNVNRANIDSTRSFLDAATRQKWLKDQRVRFVVLSTFLCSPARSNYNDTLPGVRPDPEFYGGCESAGYKASVKALKASTGLLEYSCSKFASAVLFAEALVDDNRIRNKLNGQLKFIYRFCERLYESKDNSYLGLNDWILDHLADQMRELQWYVDRFFEDTAGDAAIVRRPELIARLELVKIPFALTSMTATRTARTRVNLGVKSLEDVWQRTRSRMGWAISPAAAAAWLEGAAARMDEKFTPCGQKHDTDLGGSNCSTDTPSSITEFQ